MKSIIVANWKMNPPRAEDAVAIVKATRKAVDEARSATVVVCPPAIYLRDVAKKYGSLRPNGKKLSFGAQNVHYERSGAFTGELSPDMVADAGGEYAIVGHSERRKMGETSAEVQKKVTAVLKTGLHAIVCVGESSRDEQGEYLKVLETQIRESVPILPKRMCDKIIMAYEPVWAIGAQAVRSATPQEVLETALFMRKILASMYSKDIAFRIPVLYGGSVDPQNAGPVLKEGGVQGLLVGRESLQEKTFPAMIMTISEL